MKRGDIITIAAPGDYGKPRPAVIVHSGFLNREHASVIVCPFISSRQHAPLLRIDVEPSAMNGLRQSSQLMVDKLLTIRREKAGKVIGRLEREAMERLEQALLFVLGFADDKA